MARVTFSLNARPTLTPSPGVRNYPFINVGGVADVGTQSAAVNAQVGTIAAQGSIMATDMAAISTQMATVVTNAGTNAGTLGVTALAALVLTGSTEMTTLSAAIASGVALSAPLATAGTPDIIVSLNTGNVASVTQFHKGLDAVLKLAAGGAGGMTP